MDSTSIAFTLVLVSVLAVVLLVVALLWSRIFTTRPGPFLRYGSLAAFGAFGSGLVYLLSVFQPQRWIVAVGDALMVLGPACLWVALSSVNRSYLGRSWLVLASGVGMFTLSLLVPEPVATAVKIGAMLVFCVAIAFEARTLPAKDRRGMTMVAVMASLYAVFCGGRLVAAGISGMTGDIYVQFFGTDPTTIVGLITVLFTAYGVLRAAQDPRPDWRVMQDVVRTQLEDRAREILASGSAVLWRVVSVPELALMRESFGEDYVEDANLALLTACRDAASDAAEVGAVGTARIVMVEPVGAPEPSRADLRARFARASPTLGETYVPDVDIRTTTIDSPQALAETAARS